MGKLIVVGLTGPTGAGKTTVSRLLTQSGYHIIDADGVAREVVLPGTPSLNEIRHEFGESVINEDGTLNRRALGAVVFADKQKLKKLEALLFPAILSRINELLTLCEQEGKKLVVLDAPTLFESGANSLCDYVIVVMAPQNARIMRIIARDNLTFDQAMQRVYAQQNDAYYLDRADYVVDNGIPAPDYSALLLWLNQILHT